jgi:hypothetical protein
MPSVASFTRSGCSAFCSRREPSLGGPLWLEVRTGRSRLAGPNRLGDIGCRQQTKLMSTFIRNSIVDERQRRTP